MFLPFDDSQPTLTISKTATSGAYDTSATDQYRQGVEILTDKQRYLGFAPKFWAGNLNHTIEPQTYGQSFGWVEDVDGTEYHEKTTFDPLTFITMGHTFPTPIVFNEGDLDKYEGVTEIYTTPFRLPTNELGSYQARGWHGSVQDGNDTGFMDKRSDSVEQFIDRGSALRYFLDYGSTYVGTVKIPNYAPENGITITPFDDTLLKSKIQELTNKTTAFQNALSNLDININGNDMNLHGKTSACAGQMVATSVTYLWRTRGI